MESTCLYDFASNFTFTKAKPSKKEGEDDEMMLKDRSGILVRRRKPFVIKTQRYTLTDEKKEQYFHQMLLLFKPFRKESELMGESPSYAAAFKVLLSHCPGSV